MVSELETSLTNEDPTSVSEIDVDEDSCNVYSLGPFSVYLIWRLEVALLDDDLSRLDGSTYDEDGYASVLIGMWFGLWYLA